MNVIVSIQGREAIPVRAVPYLSGWMGMTHDDLVHALVGDEHFYEFDGLRAYHQQGQTIKPFLKRDWYNIATQLGAADDRVKAREVTHRDGVAQFRRECLRLMPAGVFVWRDEFEPLYRKMYLGRKPHFNMATEEQMPHEERAENVTLDFDPHISGDELRVAMEGFGATTLAPSDAVAPVPEETQAATEPAPLVEAPASEPKAKRTTAFNGVLPYLQAVHRNGKFKTTDDFIRELVKQSGEVDSPFKSATRTDSTFYLMSGGQSVSHSLIADRMKEIR